MYSLMPAAIYLVSLNILLISVQNNLSEYIIYVGSKYTGTRKRATEKKGVGQNLPFIFI